jgi:hypothetical protein
MIISLFKEKRNIGADLLRYAVFSIAFGYIEGAVVHYLRLLYYPGGFTLPLAAIEAKTVLIEMGRELATLALLSSAAMFSARPLLWKSAVFVYLFAVWDLSYYGALYLFEGWPGSLLDWDVLFLVPVPWLAPVLAPVVISLLGIAGSVIVFILLNNRGLIRIGNTAIILFCCSLAVWLYTFFTVSIPAHYSWGLFCAGVVLTLTGFFFIFRENSKKNF